MKSMKKKEGFIFMEEDGDNNSKVLFGFDAFLWKKESISQ